MGMAGNSRGNEPGFDQSFATAVWGKYPGLALNRQKKVVVVSAVSLSLYHLTAVSGVGSSPTLVTCETSQVLLAGVSGVFLGILPFLPHLLIGPSQVTMS